MLKTRGMHAAGSGTCGLEEEGNCSKRQAMEDEHNGVLYGRDAWCRLEHSMGVAHLAHMLADKIYDVQRAELDISRSDVKCAEVAGGLLCQGHWR